MEKKNNKYTALLECDETRVAPARFAPAIPVLHGHSTSVLLYILHNANGFRLAYRHARRRGGPG